MSNTNDNPAKVPEDPKKVVEVTVAVTANDLTISDNAVARIQAVYDQFVKEHVSDDVSDDIKEELK